MKKKKLSWLIGAMFAMPLLGSNALAQQDPAPKTDDPMLITVTGIRSSVRHALDAKEASNNMIEAIVAEDIGKLPDTTIAESLARLPGMNSGIDRGNASQVVARGLGPRFIAATLDGRELATPEPNRAVRFEQFPSESLIGANIYKTQSAEVIEGGIGTTVDLLTVSPLKYKEQQLTLKADALYYPMGNSIGGAPTTGPRLGGMYLDQFNNHTLGVAIAASYQDQPSLQRLVEHWGFNESNSGTVNGGDGKIDKTPWGIQDDVKRGTDTRSSMLGKVEWKPVPDALITADTYYEKQAIREPELAHYFSNTLGNWNGGNSANYSNPDIRNGYVVGATVSGVDVVNNDNLWVQDSSTLATGLNAKLTSGVWKLEGDLSNSLARRDSAWRNLQQTSTVPANFTWDFPGNGVQNYSIAQNTGDPSIFGAPTMNINTDGHVKDELSALHLTASRPLDGMGDFMRIKLGVRATDREKSYSQTTWSVNPNSVIPNSAYETVQVDGMPSFVALTNFDSTAYNAFGGNVFSANGRVQTQADLLAGWDVKERSESAYAQADLEGNMLHTDYRGNLGIRLVHTTHTSDGVQSLNGAAATPVEYTGADTEVLPSLNLVFMMDPKQEQQIRFGLARAMARAPLDELRASQSLGVPTTSSAPVTGSAGNPLLKPMLADQVDLAYQWYFDKGALLSAGLFFKKLQSYIKIEDNPTTFLGQNALITQSVNASGGDVRGLELIYQQAFTSLPAPFNGLGIFSSYAYTTSNISETLSGGTPFPVDGLMRGNGGATLWYEQAGYEARLAVNYHSAFTRNPTWTAGQFWINEAETNVSLNLSKQISKQFQVHFGVENLTDQKVVYTDPNNPYVQQVFDFGRRYNLGLSYKM